MSGKLASRVLCAPFNLAQNMLASVKQMTSGTRMVALSPGLRVGYLCSVSRPWSGRRQRVRRAGFGRSCTRGLAAPYQFRSSLERCGLAKHGSAQLCRCPPGRSAA